MERNLQNVFFNPQIPEVFQNIVKNRDIEDLLRVPDVPQSVVHTATPKVDNKDFIPQIFPRKAQKKHPVTVKVKSIGKIRKTYEAEQVEKLSKLLEKNEELINTCSRQRTNEEWERSPDKLSLESLLQHGDPLSRAGWKCLTKLNLYNFKYPKQVIREKEKAIILSGSLGGDAEGFDYDCSIANLKKKTSNDLPENVHTSSPAKNLATLSKTKHKKRGILACTNVEFKPGPLSRKPSLSKSIRHDVGPLELVRVPPVGLEVFPRVGVKLDSAACYHLKNIRQPDGRMDVDWAKFATSLVEQQNMEEKETQTSHTFIVPYENNQRRILMQKDLDFTENFISQAGDSNLAPVKNLNLESDLINIKNYKTSDEIELAVKNVLSDLINTVAIGEIQDRIWKYDEDYNPVEINSFDHTVKTENKKCIKRKNNELRRLDVTVIDVNDVNNENEICSKECCNFGCVCSSLRTSYLLNEHCGRPECMLECSCKLEKFSYNSTNDDSTLEISKSAVVNFQNHVNRYLAKEEKKFKRTVIRSKDQTIVMGACRRGSRIPKKYEDFYFDTNAIDENIAAPKEVKIVLARLPRKITLTPWCMVHQLYMCFCKGLFTEGTPFKYSYFSPIELRSDDDKINDDHSFGNAAGQISSETPDKPITVRSPLHNYSFIEELESDTCSRTTYFEKYIKKSRKCKLKYAERNCRIKRAELVDPMNLQILFGHVQNSYKAFMEGKTRTCRGDALPVNRNVVKEITNNDSDNATVQTEQDLVTTKGDPSIPFPTQNNTFVYRWSRLIKDYRNQNIYIWVTLQKPLRTYITNTSTILSKQFCLPIPNATPVHESILDLHPPMLRDIVEFNTAAHKSVILIGKPFAWELVGSVVEEKKNPPEINTKDTSDTTLVNISKKLDSVFVWPKLVDTGDKVTADIEKVTMSSASAHADKRDEAQSGEQTNALVDSSESPEITTSIQTKGVVKSIVLKSKFKRNRLTQSELLNSRKRKSTSDTIESNPISNSTNLRKSEVMLSSTDNLVQADSPCETVTASLIKSNPISSTQLKKSDGMLSTLKIMNPVQEISLLKSKQLEKSDKVDEPTTNSQKEPDIPARIIKKVNCLPRQNIPTLKLSSKQLIKLPATVTAPLVTSDHKYRWLLLHIENDFTEIKVPEKKFQISREDIIEAMTLAEKSGKTCKFPPCSNQQDLSVPVFGIYAVPGNQMKEVFIGPYQLDEQMGLKIALKKGFSEKRTWGSWTKALDKPHIIVCNRDKNPGSNMSSTKGVSTRSSSNTAVSRNDASSKPTNTVVVLEPFSMFPIQFLSERPSVRSILKSSQSVKVSPGILPSVEHSTRATPSSQLNKETPNSPTESILSKLYKESFSKDVSDQMTTCKSPSEIKILDNATGSICRDKDTGEDVEDHKVEYSEDDEEDDVIFMPTKQEIVEISDSEDEVDNDKVSAPCQVWFICTNIPTLGYIAAMQKKDNSVTLKFSNLGPIECSDPTTAKVSINLLLTSYVGFEPKTLSCHWTYVKDSQDVQNLKPVDERKLNKYHVITEEGLVARGLGSKQKDSPVKES